MLTPEEIDQLVSLTLADLKILTPEEYRAMSVEVQRQSLAGEPTNHEKILEAGRRGDVNTIVSEITHDQVDSEIARVLDLIRILPKESDGSVFLSPKDYKLFSDWQARNGNPQAISEIAGLSRAR